MRLVVQFLQEKSFESKGIFPKDVDFSGTFDKTEVIDFLLSKNGFAMEGICFSPSRLCSKLTKKNTSEDKFLFLGFGNNRECTKSALRNAAVCCMY
jgi:hypothetical protein